MRRPLHRPIAVTALALLVLGLGTAASSAAPADPDPAGCLPVLEDSAAGSRAVAALGRDLPAVARANGRTAAELRLTLEGDDALHVSECGRLFFVDEFGEHDDHAHDDEAAAGTEPVSWTSWDAWDPTEALAAVGDTDVTTLHSNPGADRVIHLDFDGAVISPRWFRTFGVGAFPPFDVDGDPATLSDVERAAVYEIWSRVVEDFAPWDVDVTTEQPSDDDLLKTGPDDVRYGTSTVITEDGPSPSGIAWVDIIGFFDYPLQGGFNFTGTGATRVSPQQVANIVSHELGHNFALLHHGYPSSSYHRGNAMWTPIMGNGGAAMSQWSDGSWSGATNPTQADVEVIGSFMPQALDPNATAPRLRVDTPVQGVIRSADEVDTWTVTAKAPIRIEVSTARFGPNLDPQLTVLDQSGAVLAAYDPALVVDPGNARPSTLDIDQVLELPGGSYTLLVEGVGGGTPLFGSTYDLGYTDYGSLGRYTIEVSRACGTGGGPSVCKPVKD